jgi:hypothetical protein
MTSSLYLRLNVFCRGEVTKIYQEIYQETGRGGVEWVPLPQGMGVQLHKNLYRHVTYKDVRRQFHPYNQNTEYTHMFHHEI